MTQPEFDQTKTSEPTKRFKVLRSYYLMTPVFLLLDLVFGWNLRISIPGDHQAIVIVYYIVCFFAAFVAFKSELSAALFSLMECAINITLHLYTVMGPVLNMSRGLESGLPSGYRFGVPEVLHFLIAGGVMLYSFHNNPIIKRSSL